MIVSEIWTIGSVKIVCISDPIVYVDVKGRCVSLFVCVVGHSRSNYVVEVIDKTIVVEKLFVYSSVICSLLVLICSLLVLICSLILLHMIQGLL